MKVTTEQHIARLRLHRQHVPSVFMIDFDGLIATLEALERIEKATLPESVIKIAKALPEAKEQWDSGNPKVCNDVFEWCADLLHALRADVAGYGKWNLQAEADRWKAIACEMEDDVRALKIGKGDFRHLIGIVKEIISGNAKAHAALDGTAYSSLLPVRIGERCADAINELKQEVSESKDRAEAYAVQCGSLQRETERMDRELGEAKAENRRLQGQLIAEQRKKEALRDCGAGSLATGKEPCKSCVKCCLKELEGANDLRRELIELQAEKNRLRQVAANLDDVNGFWEAVRGMTLGDAGRPVVARLMLTMAAIDNWRSCMCGECSCEKCGPILGPRYSVKSQGDLIASDRRNQGRRVFLTIAPATATHCGTDTAQQNRCSRLFFQHGNWFCSFVESSFLEGGKDGQKIPSRLRQCISAELVDVEQRAARR